MVIRCFDAMLMISVIALIISQIIVILLLRRFTARSIAQVHFICTNCRNPIALCHDLISKNFVGKLGIAYMFSHAKNIIVGEKNDKTIMTGQFSIADIDCSNCREVLGWKYVKAYNDSQRFKEGKFILEFAKITKFYSFDR